MHWRFANFFCFEIEALLGTILSFRVKRNFRSKFNKKNSKENYQIATICARSSFLLRAMLINLDEIPRGLIPIVNHLFCQRSQLLSWIVQTEIRPQKDDPNFKNPCTAIRNSLPREHLSAKYLFYAESILQKHGVMRRGSPVSFTAIPRVLEVKLIVFSTIGSESVAVLYRKKSTNNFRRQSHLLAI